LRGVSLFANVGIAETYIKNHKIDIVVANELLEKRAKFYQEIYPKCKMICGDITDKKIYNKVLLYAKKQKCDFLIATPPCQGMSKAGKMQEDDSRNTLIKFVIRMVKELHPKYALIENVPTAIRTSILVNGKIIKIIDYVNEKLVPLGYYINPVILDAADYGTPQTRRRAFFLISKEKMWYPPKKRERITVKDAIGHLPSLESGQKSHILYHNAKKHNERHVEFLRHTPSGKTALENDIYYPKKKDGTRVKGFATTYKRIEWDKPAPTITNGNGSISSQNNVHPGVLLPNGDYSDARVLTLKEIFILTGLPKDWHPPKWASEFFIRTVIGEGVPPKLIDAILSNIPK
jgi:DNA (cytosine-5)-methyltransferase 1